MFTVVVDGAGNVTLDQLRAVVHTPNTGPDQSTTLLADNLVTLTATITDKDGDSATATQNIGQNLVFLDDAPSITANATTATLTVDETNLALNAGPTNFASSFTPGVRRRWRRHDHLCAERRGGSVGPDRHGDRRRR